MLKNYSPKVSQEGERIVSQRRSPGIVPPSLWTPGLAPGVEARVFAHFGVELQRQHIAPAAKRLMRVDMARRQQFRARRQGRLSSLANALVNLGTLERVEGRREAAAAVYAEAAEVA